MSDPVMELAVSWSKSTDVLLAGCGARMLEAIKLRPRGDAEQAQEIERLKARVAELTARVDVMHAGTRV